jgi:hypothetical protein
LSQEAYDVTDIWNDLLEGLVQAKTVKSFEILLDKYWENQEVECDYNEEIVAGVKWCL